MYVYNFEPNSKIIFLLIMYYIKGQKVGVLLKQYFLTKELTFWTFESIMLSKHPIFFCTIK